MESSGTGVVVARDGIEPPTPAFSGPRSTTELPGLSADFVARSCAGVRRGRKRVGFLEQWAATTFVSIATRGLMSQTGIAPESGIAHFVDGERETLPYTGYQPCELTADSLP